MPAVQGDGDIRILREMPGAVLWRTVRNNIETARQLGLDGAKLEQAERVADLIRAGTVSDNDLGAVWGVLEDAIRAAKEHRASRRKRGRRPGSVGAVLDAIPQGRKASAGRLLAALREAFPNRDQDSLMRCVRRWKAEKKPGQ